MSEKQKFEPIKIWIAENPEGAEALKRAGVEPIVLAGAQPEIYVYYLVWNEEMRKRILYGHRYNSSIVGVGKFGYAGFIYTELDMEQLLEHLSNPNKHRGES